MKSKRLKIKVNRPVGEVFEFTTNPKNTHLWVPGMKKEKTNEWPVKVGTQYLNTSDGLNWSKYTVSELERNKLFTLSSDSSSYSVRYTYKPLKVDSCEMVYHEWVEEGELEEPFTQSILDKLKKLLESN